MMIDESIKAVKAYLYDRTASPLWGAFIFAWIAWNYEVILIIFSSLPVLEKISYIKANTSWCLSFWKPLIASVGIIIIYPWPAYGAFWLWKKYTKKINDTKRFIEGEELLTISESRALKMELYQIKLSHDTELNGRDAELQRKNEEIEFLKKTISEFTEETKILKNEVHMLEQQREKNNELFVAQKYMELEHKDKVLLYIANADKKAVSHNDILKFARNEKIDKIYAENAIDQLNASGFISTKSASDVSGYLYILMPPGRQYLIDNNLIGKEYTKSVWDEIEGLKRSHEEINNAYENLKLSHGKFETTEKAVGFEKNIYEELAKEISTKPKSIQLKFFSLYKRASQAYVESKYGEAAEYLVQASNIHATAFALGAAAECYANINELDKADKYYQQAIELDGSDSEIMSNYAVFLNNRKGEKQKAGTYFKHAIELSPKDAQKLCNYALYLHNDAKDYDLAEKYYKMAISADPDYIYAYSNYAVFLHGIRKDFDKAEEYYIHSIDNDSKNVNSLVNYALLLKDIRKEYDKSEEYFKRALDSDSKDFRALGNYAEFLHGIREDYDEAEKYYKQAIEADPQNARILGNYASLLTTVRKDYDQAEEYYKQAIEISPELTNISGNYALFLWHIRGDNIAAEKLFNGSLSGDPSDSNILGNYGGFLLSIGRKDDGFDKINRAMDYADVELEQLLILECWFYRYAHSRDNRTDSIKEVKKRIVDGVRSPHFDLSQNVERAIADGHPEPELLKVLAKVIADEENAEKLDEFEVWRNA